MVAAKLGGVDPATVKKWFDRFREAVELDIFECGEDYRIGGTDIIVEIDESKFGKRKYNRGHRVEGVWVVGGRERTPEKRMFAVKVHDRTATTLLDVIVRHVNPGSIIITDCWKGYRTDGLLDEGMIHCTVNHSETFVDKETGAHTNSIEGTWSAMKWKIPVRKRTEEDIEGHLFEYMWKANNKEDLWSRLLVAMKSFGEYKSREFT